jgi:GWxTD domain-containing protein
MNLLLCLLLLGTSATSLKSWTDGPVSIVISDVERKAFAQLKTDSERQQFIDYFWASRDSNPETRSNEYKAEFDRRVEMADQLFGGDSGMEGWRTERGRIYVLLGPPSSRAQFKTYSELRPVELWFYSGRKEYPQLPPFFYLMFFQRDEVGDYRHYSPFRDQPQSLVKAVIRDNADAFRILNNINSDLARASLSLIPGDPVDTTNFVTTMTSDAILSQINQIPRRDYERLGMLRALVNVNLRYGGTTSMTLYPFRTGPETFIVDLAIDRPNDLGDATVETIVSGDGKEIGRTHRTFPNGSPIVGRLILKSGEYLVESNISDGSGKQHFHTSEELHLKPSGGALSISNVLFFKSAPAAVAAEASPFTYFGYQFNATTQKQFHPADKLQVLFQVVTAKAGTDANGKVAMDYTIVGASNTASRWTFHDEIAMDRFDANGLLLNSKTMSIRELTAGRYFLVIKATDPAGHRASQTVSFEVIETSE